MIKTLKTVDGRTIDPDALYVQPELSYEEEVEMCQELGPVCPLCIHIDELTQP